MRFVALILMAALCGVTCVPDELPKDTNEIKTLTVEQAKALAQHKYELSLNGLTTLSDEAAKVLAKHEGVLYLEGPTTLSGEAAKCYGPIPESRCPKNSAVS